MRLLSVQDGKLRLIEYNGGNPPPYAILSHTWGSEAEEVTFRDLREGSGPKKAGYRKIEFCMRQAAADGLAHFWIDTCCIDKSNSTELSEAINSMFRWYKKATRCYVYMSDVSAGGPEHVGQLPQSAWEPTFRESRWFTRAWTLQELLAPHSVEFFTLEGSCIGDKKSLQQEIHEITDISVAALQGGELTDFSVEERMSWAGHRQATREEDNAYALLGIFDIYMPPIYGEGRRHALRRLRKEIEEYEREEAEMAYKDSDRELVHRLSIANLLGEKEGQTPQQKAEMERRLDAIRILLSESTMTPQIDDAREILGDNAEQVAEAEENAEQVSEAEENAEQVTEAEELPPANDTGSTSPDAAATATRATVTGAKRPKLRSELKAGGFLDKDEQLTSPNGRFILINQGDGNLVLYDMHQGRYPLWSSGTCGLGDRKVVMQDDGNLVMLFQSNNWPVWATGSNFGDADPVLTVRDDGNVVITSHGQKIWHTKTKQKSIAEEAKPLRAGATLRENQALCATSGRYRFVMQEDLNLVLYDNHDGNRVMWASDTYTTIASEPRLHLTTDGNLIIFDEDKEVWSSETAGQGDDETSLVVQEDGNVVLYAGDTAIWSTGTWQE